MSYINEANELKKNIQIMTNTFEKNNLQVLNIGCKPFGDDDADLTVYVELASIAGSSIPYDLALKINLYTDSDELYMVKHVYIEEDIFNGYDTVTIECFDSKHTLERAKKGRLYVVRD